MSLLPRSLLAMTVALGIASIFPDDGSAYTCMAVVQGQCIAWPVSSQPVPFEVNTTQSVDLDAATAISEARQGMAVWTDICSACFSSQFAGETSAEPADGDLTNTISWVANDWPFGEETIGLTSVAWNSEAPEIVEADMLLNNVDYTWENLAGEDPGAPAGVVDALSIIVHEAGHFYGLDHTTDQEATMFPSYAAGSIAPRTPAADDISGISALYPCATVPEGCDPAGPADDDDDDDTTGTPGGGQVGGGACADNPNAPGCQPTDRKVSFENESSCGCAEIDRPFFPAGSTFGEKALWLAFQLAGILLTAGLLARTRSRNR